MIAGKGFFVWRVENILARSGDDLAGVVASAVNAGIQHLIVKIADGSEPYPLHRHDPTGTQEQNSAIFIQEMQNAGITVWGWSFVYGDRTTPELQAQLFARRAQQFQLSGLVINAERDWKNQQGAGRANILATVLRAEMGDDIPLALSSYRYPSIHTDFPFVPFMEICDVAMPQVYWAQFGGQEGDAVLNLQKSYDEYATRFPKKLFVPTGAAFGEPQPDGSFWTATPNQIERFLAHAQEMGLPAINFWSWEHAIGDPDNPHFNDTALWDAIATFNYQPTTLPPTPAPELPADEGIVQVNIDSSDYLDGLHSQQSGLKFVEFERAGIPAKYAKTVETPSTLWSAWLPNLTQSGNYLISIWVPGKHASTKQARYHLHGVVGQSEPTIVKIDQSHYFDEWVTLGEFQLDTNMPQAGQVQLTNHTGEPNKEVAFTPIRWQLLSPTPIADDMLLADGFDPPIGTERERRTSQIWPGKWFDFTGYNVLYTLRHEQTPNGSVQKVQAYHTGADLNLPRNEDHLAPLFAVANGEVTFSHFVEGWGELIVIRHDPLAGDESPVYSRYAHMQKRNVQTGERVTRGQLLGLIGQGDPDRPFGAHLHFDISHTDILASKPGHWPGLRRKQVTEHYLDPKQFIEAHRPDEEESS